MAKRGYSDSYLQQWWRRAVKAYHGEYCVRCGNEPVECHHIVKRRYSVLRNDWRNGLPLCQDCHAWVERTVAGRRWAENQVDIVHLERKDINLKQYLTERGMTRSEFDKEQLSELRRVVEEMDK